MGRYVVVQSLVWGWGLRVEGWGLRVEGWGSRVEGLGYIEGGTRGTDADVDIEEDHGLWARRMENLVADSLGVEPELPLWSGYCYLSPKRLALRLVPWIGTLRVIIRRSIGTHVGGILKRPMAILEADLLHAEQGFRV
jgi:hypothetical protein